LVVVLNALSAAVGTVVVLRFSGAKSRL